MYQHSIYFDDSLAGRDVFFMEEMDEVCTILLQVPVCAISSLLTLQQGLQQLI